MLLLSTRKAAEKLSVRKQSIAYYVKRGYLKPLNDDPRYWVFDAKQIEDFLILKNAPNV